MFTLAARSCEASHFIGTRYARHSPSLCLAISFVVSQCFFSVTDMFPLA